MNSNERLNLQKMIHENNVDDFTNDIREKKHSEKIRNDVNMLLKLKKENLTNDDDLFINNCKFLFNNYTDIYNRVKKDEIDLNILWELLDILKKIENFELDQHSGSYEVGKLLKQIYIDSALKREKKLDQQNKKKEIRINKKITWNEYKKKYSKK